jgi:acetyl-CoA carboxylase beta subunit
MEKNTPDEHRREIMKEIEEILSKLPTCKIIIYQNKYRIEYEVIQKKHYQEKIDIMIV